MPDLRPPDPRGMLAQAATNTGAFQSVRRSIFPDEIREGRLPTWALDPREQEQDHASTSSASDIYQAPIEYIAYIAVESGPAKADRQAAKGTLKDLRGQYLTELFSHVAQETTTGAAEKTGRIQEGRQHGESVLLMDAISITFTQTQIYK